MNRMVDLENEIIMEAVSEIPEGSRIFTGDHINYVDTLTGQIMLNDLKGELLNAVECLNLPEKVERAVKRIITNSLHDTHNHITECLEFVRASKDCSTCRHKYEGSIENADICADCKIISRGYLRYAFDTGHNDTGSIIE